MLHALNQLVLKCNTSLHYPRAERAFLWSVSGKIPDMPAAASHYYCAMNKYN